MKPETLQLFRRKLRNLSEDSLYQFLTALLEEIRRRGNKLNHIPKHNGFWELKDCEPTRGD